MGRKAPEQLLFVFTASYSGGKSKTHEAVVIVDSQRDYWQLTGYGNSSSLNIFTGMVELTRRFKRQQCKKQLNDCRDKKETRRIENAGEQPIQGVSD
jgi:hypothetical protein